MHVGRARPDQPLACLACRTERIACMHAVSSCAVCLSVACAPHVSRPASPPQLPLDAHNNPCPPTSAPQSAGDIVALFGIECASGDTFTDGSVNLAMTSIRVPEPVMSVSLTPKSTDQLPNFQRALQRFQREDPTFHVGNNAGARGAACGCAATLPGLCAHMRAHCCSAAVPACPLHTAAAVAAAVCAWHAQRLARPSSAAWASCTWTSTWSACAASTR